MVATIFYDTKIKYSWQQQSFKTDPHIGMYVCMLRQSMMRIATIKFIYTSCG